jgi:hypothetical protein
VVAIGAGYLHSLALRGNGTVVAWGDNSAGQCTPPDGLSGVTSVVAGYYRSAAVRKGSPVALSPWLDARISQANIVFSWPAVGQGFLLQTTSNVADPDSWTTVTLDSVVRGGSRVVTVAPSPGHHFYRLHKP